MTSLAAKHHQVVIAWAGATTSGEAEVKTCFAAHAIVLEVGQHRLCSSFLGC